jgi:hypothetical protein
LFIDWQAFRQRLWPGRITLLATVPSRLLIGATVMLAVAVGALWNCGGGLRAAMNLGGLVDWRTIWYPVLSLSLAWFLSLSLIWSGRYPAPLAFSIFE